MEKKLKKQILINAIYPEEKRVAIVEDGILADFYVELSEKEHLRGNIYKAVVVRVEPGLQAAFVDFGQKKHGFLQMKEITPEYLKGAGEGRQHPRIQDVIRKGQEMIVQVEKDERDTKGARLTTYISLPGRYIVMLPGQDHVGVSRKIEAREDRERLKEMFRSLKLPKNTGFILRTACGDQIGEELGNDLKYLTKLWNRIQTEAKKAAAPALVYREHDIAVRTVRDYLTSDVETVLIDEPGAFKKIKDFLRRTAPWLKTGIRYYNEKKPIFSMHDLERQIAQLSERFISLPSRGHIVIDGTEALTAIDVNSGRSKKEEHIEATALRTNLEAADALSRQLRLRDIGGLIVIDFIDMESSKNRRAVENRLKEVFAADKAHFEITGISKFGLVEITRERLRPAYAGTVSHTCETCGGAGVVKSGESIARAALKNIQARAAAGDCEAITCSMPVESLNYLINTRREELLRLEKDFGVPVKLSADSGLAGKFELQTVALKPGPAKGSAGAEVREKDKKEHYTEPKGGSGYEAEAETDAAASGIGSQHQGNAEAVVPAPAKAEGGRRKRWRRRSRKKKTAPVEAAP